MRIKIIGPITPERLIEAVEKATFEFSTVMGEKFEGFYGANLYLEGYSSEGERVEISNKGKERMLVMPLPAGAMMRPAVSEDAKARKEQRRRIAEERQRLAEEYSRKAQEEQQRRRDEKNAFRQIQVEREAQFKLLLDEMGNDLISACNAVIEDVWKRESPVWPSGADKGTPRPMPCMRLIDGVVHLYSKEGASARKIKTPVSFLSSSYSGGLEAYWKHSAWVDHVVPELMTVIEILAAKSIASAEKDGDEMPGGTEEGTSGTS